MAVIACSVVSGVVATTKSLIESRVITTVANMVDNHDYSSLFTAPIGAVGSDDSDPVSRVAGSLLTGMEFGQAVVVYVLISAVTALLIVITSAARETISCRLFSELFEAGVKSAFTRATTRLDQQDDEPGGAAGAIQQGARAVSGAYALLVEAVQYLFTLGTILIVLVRVHLGFAGLCAAVALLFATISFVQGRRLGSQREEFDDRRRSLFSFTADVLANRDVLLAHERRDTYVERLRASSLGLGKIDRHLSVRESRYLGSINFINDLGQIGILAVVLAVSMQGTDVTSVGDAYFYVSLFARLTSPIRGLLNGYDSVRRSMSTSKTLVDLLGQRLTSSAGSGSPAAVGDDAVVFEDVQFAYSSEGPAVVAGCSFRVPSGGVTLIVGRSGIGKTTLARLLLGFIEPTEGEVRVHGVPTRDWNSDEMLLQMSYLAQTGHVIDGSVRENLFAADDMADSLLTSALSAAGLHGEGSGDLLDKRAKTLSEGQKQRLALARILADTAPIVVLDEPLAGVDGFTFAEIRGPLSVWMADPRRTVVIVSHRLAFASSATHVVVLGDHASVMEQGTPKELAAIPGGRFATLLAVARDEASAAPKG